MTTTEPLLRAVVIAFWNVAPHAPPPPRDRLITRAGNRFAPMPDTLTPQAHTIASAMSDVRPPQRPSTRSGTTFAPNATPATPLPLFVTAAIVPATCVPCQLELNAGSPAAQAPA